MQNSTLAHWRYHPAVAVMQAGGVIAYPTEAVWGLGCDPYNPNAVAQLLAVKRRPAAKGLILVAAELAMLGELFEQLEPLLQQRLQQSLQQRLQRVTAKQAIPTTWLIPHRNLIPSWIVGEHDTVAVRVSQHPLVQGLCSAYGGMIVSTSANPATLRPAQSELKARCYFGSGIDYYLSGKLGGAQRPSQIRDLVTDEVLR